jgi:hypothetical protein
MLKRIEMKEYLTSEMAIEAAKAVTKCNRVAVASDFCSLAYQGYQEDGQVCFRIYRSFTKKLKPCFIVRYPYID